jgi:hypothetical protein
MINTDKDTMKWLAEYIDEQEVDLRNPQAKQLYQSARSSAERIEENWDETEKTHDFEITQSDLDAFVAYLDWKARQHDQNRHEAVGLLEALDQPVFDE